MAQERGVTLRAVHAGPSGDVSLPHSLCSGRRADRSVVIVVIVEQEHADKEDADYDSDREQRVDLRALRLLDAGSGSRR